MILSDRSIEEYVHQGLISVRPSFDSKQLRPVGLRVHLADDILIPAHHQIIDLSSSSVEKPQYIKLNLQGQALTLPPNKFVLGSTIESFKVAKTLICRLDGRSTLARLGIIIHCTSTIIDSMNAEYRSIVLEIANLSGSTIIIPRNYPIGLVTFETLSSPVSNRTIQAQYAGQDAVEPPNLNFRPDDYNL